MSSQRATLTGRERTNKACDRCRRRKAKCKGASPCAKCKADNAICVFGQRKNKPNGYVEALEQEKAQLVAGLRKLYILLQQSNGWPGKPLPLTKGYPLTHDILERVGALDPTDHSSGYEDFERQHSTQSLEYRHNFSSSEEGETLPLQSAPLNGPLMCANAPTVPSTNNLLPQQPQMAEQDALYGSPALTQQAWAGMEEFIDPSYMSLIAEYGVDSFYS
ncbi:hypothetical protein K469DRAFT_589839 [Zopfia rhizophila CBS 207.26]|uniref:Zn(2)-C6 fungal-type domain-containing protein n=1 Tax=Zopfia rhizophila CBS 207.26 TaxID=1314779 RepID=A0A6A6DSR8_9PEZI|nr:hypothetical protein K469DRAFT_589839 [Zopfia rhizophila CBS 207.26]